MKLLFSLLALILTTKECENKNSNNESSEMEIVNSEKANIQQKEYTIEYSAISRGIFKEITIDNSGITVKKDRNSKPVTKECTNELWSKLTKTLDEIDLKMLPKLKAPTQKRLFDGAAHATLKVIVGGETYTTSSFDHGFPPEEIKELCDKLIEISVDTKE